MSPHPVKQPTLADADFLPSLALSTIRYLSRFFRLGALSGIVLFLSAVLATVVVNSSYEPLYNQLLELPFKVQLGDFKIAKPLLLWINDGLMAIFFFLVGLEIKREFKVGQLSSPDQMILPAIAAVGGMVFPALVYVLCNALSPENLSGWAIPAATDIAFALGVLSLFGKRVPFALKIFLAAQAIFDDLGAIIVIALFYTEHLSLNMLSFAGVLLLILLMLNLLRIKNLPAYLIFGLLLWICVLKSGVHATLAGVVLALCIPFTPDKHGNSLVQELEHALHPWVAYLILPIFAFANAGISFSGLSISSFFDSLTLGVALGLLIGKPLGVVLCCEGAKRLGWLRYPKELNRQRLIALGCLAGIGFTMSLFIGALAFSTPVQLLEVRLGVVTGSLLSGILGSVLLWRSLGRR